MTHSKNYFHENKDILIEFISLVTGIKKEDFDEIKLQNKEIGKEYYDEKYGIVDVKVRLKSGVKINIEMQNKYYSYYPKRSLYYWTKIFTEDIKETNLYKELHKTISIC
ncbi:MAG: PD-(D/E)XK nuclease family transposase [Peptoanaerobacter stomatis]|uniref:PD-(D/E)XK nuclease family transposase n=1 Tax=Peptoanaerobacter stomatis TaxID=796937 RepID=UPI003FA0C443